MKQNWDDMTEAEKFKEIYRKMIKREGAYDKAAQTDFRELNQAQKQCKLAVMLHIADMMATHFDESEVEQ